MNPKSSSRSIICGDEEKWGSGDVEMWRSGDVEMWIYGDVEMWRCGDVEFLLHLDRLPNIFELPSRKRSEWEYGYL